MASNNNNLTSLEIAIIAMACRVPGANNWRDLWSKLNEGACSLQTVSPGKTSSGNEAGKKLVNVKGSLPGKEFFDSNFFNYTPVEADFLNPSHRVFHQCVWEALEDAGCDPAKSNGIGLFGGASDDANWKLYANLRNQNKELDDFVMAYLIDKDYLCSLISYKLNLNGPSVAVNTACSTSLVAVNLACNSLLLGETRLALAGGVSVHTHKLDGYYYQQGMIHSKDGMCRAFDKDASGTVFAEGAGVVTLKRLKDAIADGDHIYALIKGTATNNDGNRKVGYTAPSVEGQFECIRRAIRMSKIDPNTISYVEAHGTGTVLGDPIEIQAINNTSRSIHGILQLHITKSLTR